MQKTGVGKIKFNIKVLVTSSLKNTTISIKKAYNPELITAPVYNCIL